MTEWSVIYRFSRVPPKGQRTKTGERTRTTILEATIRILGRDGPDRFSASTLAKEAGVSKATLFHHFRTLDEIPIVAMEKFWVQSFASKSADRTSARVYLLELGALMLALPQRRATLLKAHVVFLVKAVFDPQLQKRLAAGAALMQGRMLQELAARSPAGVERRELEIVAHIVAIALDGLMMAAVTARSPAERNLSRRAWTRLVDLMVTELKP